MKSNYVEDDDGTMRYSLSSDHIKWVLAKPGYNKDFHIGVRSKQNQKIFGFIAGSFVKMKINESTIKTM
jgi:glycylpeptide N-tetradecanoyltransferase